MLCVDVILSFICNVFVTCLFSLLRGLACSPRISREMATPAAPAATPPAGARPAAPRPSQPPSQKGGGPPRPQQPGARPPAPGGQQAPRMMPQQMQPGTSIRPDSEPLLVLAP